MAMEANTSIFFLCRAGGGTILWLIQKLLGLPVLVERFLSQRTVAQRQANIAFVLGGNWEGVVQAQTYILDM